MALYEEAGPLAEFCLQLFPLLVVHSDDYGRLDGDPQTVRLRCDPGSPRPLGDFRSALDFLSGVGLIVRYHAEGASWIQIVKFDEHQRGLLSKRSIAVTPAPPPLPELPGNSTLTQPNLTQPNLTQEKTSADAQEFSEARRPETVRGPVEARPSAFLSFPVIGSGDKAWLLSEAQVAEWVALFPGLDVRGEARKALAWVQASPGRRKTARGMARFLVGWFSRTADRGGGRIESAPVRSKGPPAFDAWECPHEPRCTEGRWKCQRKTDMAAVNAK